MIRIEKLPFHVVFMSVHIHFLFWKILNLEFHHVFNWSVHFAVVLCVASWFKFVCRKSIWTVNRFSILFTTIFSLVSHLSFHSFLSTHFCFSPNISIYFLSMFCYSSGLLTICVYMFYSISRFRFFQQVPNWAINNVLNTFRAPYRPIITKWKQWSI